MGCPATPRSSLRQLFTRVQIKHRASQLALRVATLMATLLALLLGINAEMDTPIGRTLLYHGTPIHNETVIGGLNAYVSRPENATRAAVVLLSVSLWHV